MTVEFCAECGSKLTARPVDPDGIGQRYDCPLGHGWYRTKTSGDEFLEQYPTGRLKGAK